jgi:uncharacterized protein YjbJ (UPF0337 family)
MSRLQEKIEAITRQAIGQMIGDDRLVDEGREQQRRAGERRRDANAREALDRNETPE